MPSNHRLLLAARPVFRGRRISLPTCPPGPGEVLLQTIYLSIDPAMRSWMSAGMGYQQGIPLGEVMRGGGIARVLARDRAHPFSWTFTGYPLQAGAAVKMAAREVLDG